MARRAAAFLESHLRHPNGLPVEVVIADTTIGGVAEAANVITKVAVESGRLTPMKENAVAKIKAGTTTLTEAASAVML
jgi:L-fucose isomerase-like protein